MYMHLYTQIHTKNIPNMYEVGHIQRHTHSLRKHCNTLPVFLMDGSAAGEKNVIL